MIMNDQIVEAYVLHLENEIDSISYDIQLLLTEYLQPNLTKEESRILLDKIINNLVYIRSLFTEYQKYEASV